MPSKNTVREYLKNGVYHVYNRGINKQNIFLNDHDYSTFLFYLKLYLDDPEKLKDLDPQKRHYLSRKIFYGKVELLCYCLMPNHFHLILKQKGEKDISEFMRCVTLNYSMCFNDKRKRVGPLFQGKYKAVLVKNDEYLLHLSRYIHLNPFAKVPNLGGKNKVADYTYSSCANYLGKKKSSWLQPKLILDYFEENKNDFNIKKSSYERFVEDYEYDIDDAKELLEDLVLE